MPEVTLGEITDLVGGEFSGDRSSRIGRLASLTSARADSLSFLSSEKWAPQLGQSQAAAILVPAAFPGSSPKWIRVSNPQLAFARVLEKWFAERPGPRGLSPMAAIAASATLGSNVSIGPFATIGDNVEIGDDVTIYQGVSIEGGSVIGAGTLIYPNVTLYHGTRIGRRCIIHAGTVIGSDGYGFVQEGGRHHKIQQIGIVRIEDDVEIGANCAVDRAALDETVIGEGTKIDNLVQIGHNVRIGRHCLLVAQVGIAGSTEIGDYVVMGGQAGATGHIRIGAGVQVAGQAGVMKDWEGKLVLAGRPARPIQEHMRSQAMVRRLPELADRIKELEKRVGGLPPEGEKPE
jgi:UDP-3-O-[3-hydroxymyristoyl] glucosamine N-acyltransferase